jgi:hypothetical protein
LKQALLDACPQTDRFRTLLLTATLKASCCDGSIRSIAASDNSSRTRSPRRSG